MKKALILQVLRYLSFGCVLLLGAAGLLSCASEAVNPNDPQSLFRDAEKSFEQERYLIALEKYQDLKNRFPYSARALDSELRIADTFYAQESYLEAESAYEIFRELHPTHPKGDYVQYQIGMSYFQMIPSVSSRDLSAAHRAIDSFNELERRFPDSSYVPKARSKIRQARGKLAELENYVADFYFNRQHFLSASYRYAALLRDFGDLGYDEQALFRLGECYYNTEMMENARSTLGRFLREYPKSEKRSLAQAMLRKLEKPSSGK